jgi:hypothetical protein
MLGSENNGWFNLRKNPESSIQQSPEESSDTLDIPALEVLVHERHKDVPPHSVGEYNFLSDAILDNNPLGLSFSNAVFIFSYSHFFVSARDMEVYRILSYSCNSDDTTRQKINDTNNHRKRLFLKFYEQRFVAYLKYLSEKSEANAVLPAYEPRSNEYRYANEVYINTSGDRHEKIDREEVFTALNDAILMSIVFNKTLPIPAEVRIRALKLIDVGDSKIKPYTWIKSFIPEKARLPLKFISPQILGSEHPHNLDSLLLQSHIYYEPKEFSSRLREPTRKTTLHLLMQAIQDYPKNALQFYQFLIQLPYESRPNALLATLRSVPDEKLLQIFDPTSSFFVENEKIIFSPTIAIQMNTGTVSAVEENEPDLPASIAEAHTVIQALNNKISGLENQLGLQKQQSAQDILALEERLAILRAQVQLPDWMRMFEPFHVSREFLQTNIATDEGRKIIAKQLTIIQNGRLKVLQSAYENIFDTTTEGHKIFQQYNSEYTAVIEWLEKVVVNYN